MCALCCGLRVVDCGEERKKKNKTPEKNTKAEKKRTHGENSVGKCNKCKEHWETCQNTDSVFRTIWPSTDPKKVRKRSFFPTHCSLHFPMDLLTFSAEGPSQTHNNAFLGPRSYSKGPNHAFGKGHNQRNTLYTPLGAGVTQLTAGTGQVYSTKGTGAAYTARAGATGHTEAQRRWRTVLHDRRRCSIHLPR